MQKGRLIVVFAGHFNRILAETNLVTMLILLVEKDEPTSRIQKGKFNSKTVSKQYKSQWTSSSDIYFPPSLDQHRLGQHLLDPAQRLPRALFVLDQREAHVPVAVVAEADARATRRSWLRSAAALKTPASPSAA